MTTARSVHEPKWTPGPWVWFETKEGIARVNPERGGVVVAECGTLEPFSAEQQANACLIAAAPDLYASLHGLLVAMDGKSPLRDTMISAFFALDKAVRGRPL